MIAGRGFPEPKRQAIHEYRVLVPTPGMNNRWAVVSSLPETFVAETHHEQDVGLALEDYINDTTMQAPEFFEGISEVLCVGSGYAYLFELERPRVTVRVKP